MDLKIVRFIIGCILALTIFFAGFVSGGAYQAARSFIHRPGSLSSGESE